MQVLSNISKIFINQVVYLAMKISFPAPDVWDQGPREVFWDMSYLMEQNFILLTLGKFIKML